jgi:hypothetical protein
MVLWLVVELRARARECVSVCLWERVCVLGVCGARVCVRALGMRR